MAWTFCGSFGSCGGSYCGSCGSYCGRCRSCGSDITSVARWMIYVTQTCAIIRTYHILASITLSLSFIQNQDTVLTSDLAKQTSELLIIQAFRKSKFLTFGQVFWGEQLSYEGQLPSENIQCDYE